MNLPKFHGCHLHGLDISVRRFEWYGILPGAGVRVRVTELTSNGQQLVRRHLFIFTRAIIFGVQTVTTAVPFGKETTNRATSIGGGAFGGAFGGGGAFGSTVCVGPVGTIRGQAQQRMHMAMATAMITTAPMSRSSIDSVN